MKSGDAVWHKVFERDQGKCQYCDMDLLQDFHHYTIASLDHVQSRKSGGAEDDLNNLVLSCHGCNIRLSRAHHLTTIEDRKKYLTDSSKGAREMFLKYKEKQKRWSRRSA